MPNLKLLNTVLPDEIAGMYFPLHLSPDVAFQALGIGRTKGWELIRDGHLLAARSAPGRWWMRKASGASPGRSRPQEGPADAAQDQKHIPRAQVGPAGVPESGETEQPSIFDGNVHPAIRHGAGSPSRASECCRQRSLPFAR